MRRATRLLLTAILTFGAFSASGCRSLNYLQEELDSFRESGMGRILTFDAAAGTQSAVYLPPRPGAAVMPQPLVVVFPGTRSAALDWTDLSAMCPDPAAGFLIVEYPGRGVSESWARPSLIPEVADGAVRALSAATGVSSDRLLKDSRVLGHSLGAPCALDFAIRHKTQRIVLLAPAKSFQSAMFARVGPLAWFLPGKLDAREMLGEMYPRSNRPRVVVFQGSSDYAFPFRQGRRLAGLFPDWIEYEEIPGAGRGDLFQAGAERIFMALLPESREAAQPALP